MRLAFVLWERGFAKCNCILRIWKIYVSDEDKCWLGCVMTGIGLLNPKTNEELKHRMSNPPHITVLNGMCL